MALKSVPRAEWEENLERWRNGMAITLPELYVLPPKARPVHQNFVDRMRQGRWAFVLVTGENGAGKSAYVRFLEEAASREGYAIAHVDVSDTEIKSYGPRGYLNLEIMRKLRMPDGRVLIYAIRQDENFRNQFHRLVEANLATLAFWSSPLAQALLLATDTEQRLRELALGWLQGQPLSAAELRELSIFDNTQKSIRSVTTDKLLFALREICCALLELRGFLATFDEVEKIGELPKAKGRESLSLLRDVINILVSEEAGPTRKGVAEGTFVVYAMSDFFLGYSGVIEVPGIDFRAQADRVGRPKVEIGDVPRLHSILRRSATRVPTDFEGLNELETIAANVIQCYSNAKAVDVSIYPTDLVLRAYENTGTFLARDNIQEMISTLDEVTASG